MTHLLVTNDFPPKVGGIQSYLYELWRRIDPKRFAVLTIAHPAAEAFDKEQQFRIDRLARPMLIPSIALARAIERAANQIEASLIILDPALPLGLIGRYLSRPYGLIVHGAEITVPARLPILRWGLSSAIRHASLVIAAGGYPAGEARAVVGTAMPETVIVPPGVDVTRFHPATAAEVAATRRRFGLDEETPLVVSVSRLVPRKGMDVLIEAAAQLVADGQDLVVVIGGSGRDKARLVRLAERLAAPVRFLGRVDDADLAGLDGAADIWAMLCRSRWGGLEEEGFGIVFLEAAATGVPQLAGRSGGAEEAVLDGVTGLVVDRPADVVVVRQALKRLLDDRDLRTRLGHAARLRAVAEFDYDQLAERLSGALVARGG